MKIHSLGRGVKKNPARREHWPMHIDKWQAVFPRSCLSYYMMHFSTKFYSRKFIVKILVKSVRKVEGKPLSVFGYLIVPFCLASTINMRLCEFLSYLQSCCLEASLTWKMKWSYGIKNGKNTEVPVLLSCSLTDHYVDIVIYKGLSKFMWLLS